MKLTKPRESHVMPRYTCVTESVIEACQQEYLAGRRPGQSIPYLGEVAATTIAVQSLEADRLLYKLPDMLMGRSPEAVKPPVSDWTLAIMADLLFAAADAIRGKRGREQKERDLRALAWATLETILNSPTASPMLSYEDILFDVAQQYRMSGDRRAVELMKRALAHDLYYEEGNNAVGLLRDMAETFLWVGDYNEGLRILTAVLQNDPSDVWTYNVITITFDHFGLSALGAVAARRGLELIRTVGDGEGLRRQLTGCLSDLEQSETRCQEDKVDPAVLSAFRAALRLDFHGGNHRPAPDLCRELILDLDQVPLKQPPGMPELPSPGEFAQSAGSGPDHSLGRNDPCWCGSGKKYKHCHMTSDSTSRKSQF